jgi:hypothetical protein
VFENKVLRTFRPAVKPPFNDPVAPLVCDVASPYSCRKMRTVVESSFHFQSSKGANAVRNIAVLEPSLQLAAPLDDRQCCSYADY